MTFSFTCRFLFFSVFVLFGFYEFSFVICNIWRFIICNVVLFSISRNFFVIYLTLFVIIWVFIYVSFQFFFFSFWPWVYTSLEEYPFWDCFLRVNFVLHLVIFIKMHESFLKQFSCLWRLCNWVSLNSLCFFTFIFLFFHFFVLVRFWRQLFSRFSQSLLCLFYCVGFCMVMDSILRCHLVFGFDDSLGKLDLRYLCCV